ncbi:MAG: glycosyltransferase family 2 protein [Candidatus Parcubacteria bacterium]|nr:glycosyltransferase family 2 protein [Candidatus Parcubacteria bacterium]
MDSIEKNYILIGRASDIENYWERKLFRFFEMLPAFLCWGTLFSVIIFSIFRPVWVSLFIIFFVTFWLLRIIYLTFYLWIGVGRMRKHEKIDWLAKIEKLPVENYKVPVKSWKDIYHLIVFPMYKEPIKIVQDSFNALLASDFPKEQMIVVLAIEESAGEDAQNMAEMIEKEYGNKFLKFYITRHPQGLPGEIPGKGSNETWALKKTKEFIIDKLAVPYENIIVSSFDIDTVVFPKYFSCLTYYYLTVNNPSRTSFQPIPLFINNIWQVPLFSRLFSFSTTFWQTMNQERPESLITFSSHSMSFKALVDVGFRQVCVVSDDSRIYWQCFFFYDGKYEVKPIFYPISMDANAAQSFLKTLVNVYKQQRRWAYGAGDISYFLFCAFRDKKTPLLKKLVKGAELIEGHWSWAMAPLLIFFLGWLPLLLGGEYFSQTLLSYNLPRVTSMILTFAMTGLIVSAYFSIVLLPPKPLKYGRLKYVALLIQWLLLPIMMIFFSSFPAIDAQTRLMFGKYLGFWPTEKFRK